MAGSRELPGPLHQPETPGVSSGGGLQTDRVAPAGSPVPRGRIIPGAPATGLDRPRVQPSGVLTSLDSSSGPGLPQRAGAGRRAPVLEAEPPVDSRASDTGHRADTSAAEPERKARGQHTERTEEAAEPARTPRRPAAKAREAADPAAQPAGADRERRGGDQPRAASGGRDIEEENSPMQPVSKSGGERASTARSGIEEQRGEATHPGAEQTSVVPSEEVADTESSPELRVSPREEPDVPVAVDEAMPPDRPGGRETLDGETGDDPSTRIFPGFEFREPESEGIRVIELEPVDPAKEREVITVIDLDLGGESLRDLEIERWDQQGVEQDLRSLMERVDQQIGEPLFAGRQIEFSFVTQEEMKPKSAGERERLKERYGDYILDTSAGDCRRNHDGSFSLRIGHAGEEETREKETVLWVGLHELGHTLGEDRLDDAVAEELKANAFAKLGMRVYHGSSDQWELPSMPEADKVHDDSMLRLKQLLDAGITEEEIIAHLTGRNFGEASPNDYLKHIAKNTSGGDGERTQAETGRLRSGDEQNPEEPVPVAAGMGGSGHSGDKEVTGFEDPDEPGVFGVGEGRRRSLLVYENRIARLAISEISTPAGIDQFVATMRERYFPNLLHQNGVSPLILVNPQLPKEIAEGIEQGLVTPDNFASAFWNVGFKGYPGTVGNISASFIPYDPHVAMTPKDMIHELTAVPFRVQGDLVSETGQVEGTVSKRYLLFFTNFSIGTNLPRKVLDRALRFYSPEELRENTVVRMNAMLDNAAEVRRLIHVASERVFQSQQRSTSADRTALSHPYQGGLPESNRRRH